MTTRLPYLLRVICKAAGEEAAFALVREFGGQWIYIPKKAPDDHRLVLAGGRIAAEAIMKESGGSYIAFPKAGMRRLKVLSMLRGGTSNNAVAKATQLSHRQVRRLRAELRGSEL